jgi:hypothetical protein
MAGQRVVAGDAATVGFCLRLPGPLRDWLHQVAEHNAMSAQELVLRLVVDGIGPPPGVRWAMPGPGAPAR